MIEKLFADAPDPGQGEIDVNPMPAPSANNSKVVASATNAPAKIAAQLTADAGDSAAPEGTAETAWL
jgi:hypothetical protein